MQQWDPRRPGTPCGAKPTRSPRSWSPSTVTLVVSNMRKSLRRGRVLIDWSQNHSAKTTVAVYSVRAMAAPTVSTPVTPAEVRSVPKRRIPGFFGSRQRTCCDGSTRTAISSRHSAFRDCVIPTTGGKPVEDSVCSRTTLRADQFTPSAGDFPLTSARAVRRRAPAAANTTVLPGSSCSSVRATVTLSRVRVTADRIN